MRKITAGSLVRFATEKSWRRIVFLLKDVEFYEYVVGSGDLHVHLNETNCLPRNNFGYWSRDMIDVIYDNKENKNE